MEVYKLIADSDHFRNVVPRNPEDWNIINSINARRVINVWDPLELELISTKKRQGDFPSLIPHFPIVSLKARNILESLVSDHVEFLPLNVEGTSKYYGMNVVTVVDCVDLQKSNPVRFHNGRIMHFETIVFQEDALSDIPIFKIPDLKNSEVFVSEAFVDIVKENGLLGFEFLKIQ